TPHGYGAEAGFADALPDDPLPGTKMSITSSISSAPNRSGVGQRDRCPPPLKFRACANPRLRALEGAGRTRSWTIAPSFAPCPASAARTMRDESLLRPAPKGMQGESAATSAQADDWPPSVVTSSHEPAR